jgi:hypothetical protein
MHEEVEEKLDASSLDVTWFAIFCA